MKFKFLSNRIIVQTEKCWYTSKHRKRINSNPKQPHFHQIKLVVRNQSEDPERLMVELQTDDFIHLKAEFSQSCLKGQ